MEHTATPWRLAKRGDGNKQLPIYAANGGIVAAIRDEGTLGDAAFIVRACNAHEELLEALKALVQASYESVNARGFAPFTVEELYRANAAIRKAEED